AYVGYSVQGKLLNSSDPAMPRGAIMGGAVVAALSSWDDKAAAAMAKIEQALASTEDDDDDEESGDLNGMDDQNNESGGGDEAGADGSGGKNDDASGDASGSPSRSSNADGSSDYDMDDADEYNHNSVEEEIKPKAVGRRLSKRDAEYDQVKQDVIKTLHEHFLYESDATMPSSVFEEGDVDIFLQISPQTRALVDKLETETGLPRRRIIGASLFLSVWIIRYIV
ncbi:MAG: hypothetical protein SGARI_001358, partial [Bacillariaceae sp.]